MYKLSKYWDNNMKHCNIVLLHQLCMCMYVRMYVLMYKGKITVLIPKKKLLVCIHSVTTLWMNSTNKHGCHIVLHLRDRRRRTRSISLAPFHTCLPGMHWAERLERIPTTSPQRCLLSAGWSGAGQATQVAEVAVSSAIRIGRTKRNHLTKLYFSAARFSSTLSKTL